MAKDAKSGWGHHWVNALRLYKRRNRLYSRLSEARAAATAEHLLLGHLACLSHHWHALEANPAKPAEIFTQLWACLCSGNPDAHAKAHDQLAALLDSLSGQDAPELWEAIETAFNLAPPLKSAGADWSTIYELIEQFPAARSRALETGFLPCDDEAVAATKLLVEEHQAQPLLESGGFESDGSWNAIMALGLAAKLGDTTALARLVSLESHHPEQVVAAYWLASTQPALERLLDALSVPHLASNASQVWRQMTGQKLDLNPTLGLAGQNKKSGPLMPDQEPALRWWQEHRGETGPWLDGQPVTVHGLQSWLTQYCGSVTQPVWWLLQFEQRRTMPNLVLSWHRYRVAQLRKESPNGT